MTVFKFLGKNTYYIGIYKIFPGVELNETEFNALMLHPVGKRTFKDSDFECIEIKKVETESMAEEKPPVKTKKPVKSSGSRNSSRI